MIESEDGRKLPKSKGKIKVKPVQRYLKSVNIHIASFKHKQNDNRRFKVARNCFIKSSCFPWKPSLIIWVFKICKY